MTPEFAELRRLAEAATPGPWSTAAFQLVIDVAQRIDVGMCGHRDDAAYIAAANPAVVLALLDKLDAAAERDALAAEADKWHRAALTLQGDRDALATKLARARALADLIDRHTEFERDPVDFRDASHGGSWDDVADRIRAALDEEPQP